MLSRVGRFGFWRTIVAYLVGTLALAAGVALMVRTFLFQPFSLPASSMAPTLPAGRLYLRGEIPLWLHPLFAAVLAAAVFGAHLRRQPRARAAM
jgi:hypothetical protein